MAQGANLTHPRPDEIWPRLIADSLPAYVAYVDEDLHYRMVNRRYEKQFGSEASEILNQSVSEVLGVSHENVRHHLEAALRGEQGHVCGIIVHGVDVTERHQAEQALRRSEDRFRILLERASVCHRIVHKHRGTLRAKSSDQELRHGTIFSLWLPRELASDAQQGWMHEPSPQP